MPSRIFSCAARARRSARARVTLRQKFFIAFLDELGNFKHFEPYLFFWSKVRQSAAAQCGWVRMCAAALFNVRLTPRALNNRPKVVKSQISM